MNTHEGQIVVSEEVEGRLAELAMDLGITIEDLVEHILDPRWKPYPVLTQPRPLKIMRPDTKQRYGAKRAREFPVACSCCKPSCKKVFVWRGVVRCGCESASASMSASGRY